MNHESDEYEWVDEGGKGIFRGWERRPWEWNGMVWNKWPTGFFLLLTTSHTRYVGGYIHTCMWRDMVSERPDGCFFLLSNGVQMAHKHSRRGEGKLYGKWMNKPINGFTWNSGSLFFCNQGYSSWFSLFKVPKFRGKKISRLPNRQMPFFPPSKSEYSQDCIWIFLSFVCECSLPYLPWRFARLCFPISNTYFFLLHTFLGYLCS